MFSRHHIVRLRLLFVFLGLVLVPTGRAAPTVTQTLDLHAGWNLISIQVGGAITPDEFRASLGVDSNKLLAVWGFGISSTPSQAPWQWRFYRPEGNLPSDLTLIEPGRGYWVHVSGYCQSTLSQPPWNGSLQLRPGWNLLGFPGLQLQENENQELASVFGSAFSVVTQVWEWNTAAQQFVGYDIASIPQIKDLPGVRAGKGYWVYSVGGSVVDLMPQPFLALPADSDASPPQPDELFQASDARYLGSDAARYVGRTVRYSVQKGSPANGIDSYDLNANGILDDAYTQDTILFEKSADTVSITIGNNGTGAFTWVLENTCPWLYTAPPDDRTWPEGSVNRPREASGTVSGEKDILLLYADRTGMTPGRKTSGITLWLGNTAVPISLLLDVSDITGDWRGFATTTRVGGRGISLGEVRLVLNSFTSNGSDEKNGFRAVLNREQSILFPRDVYMDGVFYASNQFKLTTNFEMPAGDRNAPPYDVFPGGVKDRDFNGNGKVDVINPFPFGLRREVTLLGKRVSPDRLEGTYIESIRGLLPPVSGNTLVTDTNQFLSNAFLSQSQPIFIEGTFVLQRQSFTPTKRSVFNESARLDLVIGGSDSANRVATFDVVTPVSVQGVTITLNLTFPDPALLQLALIGPNLNNDPYVIHQFGDTNAIPTTISIPANVFTGAGNGTWTLQIDWDGATGERGTLTSWGLDIEGAATHQAAGRIVKAGGAPVEVIPGATIRLEGGVTTQTFTSATNGTFTIPSLSENDYTLYITKPGYQTTAYTFFVSEKDVALGDIAISPLALSEPQLRAAPPIGYAGTQPFVTELTVDLPLNFPGTTVAWDFDGNGTTDRTGPLAALTQVTQEYATPGVFTAKVVLSGGALASPVTKTQAIHVHRAAPDPAGRDRQILLTGFVGALGARSDVAAASPAAPPVAVAETNSSVVSYLGPSAVTLASGVVVQESLWDPATFDYDRVPSRTASPFPGPEDLDLTPNHPALRYVRFNTNSPNLTKYEALLYSQIPAASRVIESNNPAGYTEYEISNGTTKPNRFRIVTTFGGAAFNPDASAVGDIRIQPGRTLP